MTRPQIVTHQGGGRPDPAGRRGSPVPTRGSAEKKISCLVHHELDMGGGGLMQLVAYGAQDIYLTGSPQITFFKTIYRRHTNFAVESIEQTFW